jgi:hypothetical protein
MDSGSQSYAVRAGMSKARDEVASLIKTAKELRETLEALGPDSDIYKELYLDLMILENQLESIHTQLGLI